jgi:hypothetical protein
MVENLLLIYFLRKGKRMEPTKDRDVFIKDGADKLKAEETAQRRKSGVARQPQGS